MHRKYVYINPVAEKILNPDTSGDNHLTNLGKMATDSQNLYLVGYLDKGSTRE